jgi:hypothetical protein
MNLRLVIARDALSPFLRSSVSDIAASPVLEVFSGNASLRFHRIALPRLRLNTMLRIY